MIHSTNAATMRRAPRTVKALAAVAGALMVVGGLAACAPPDKGSDGGASGGTVDTITYGIIGATSDTIAPWRIERGISGTVFTGLVFEGLTSLDRKGAVKMELAESMEPNETLDVWTVTLREGVKFHDGSDFDADDVVHSIQHMLDPENQFPPANQIAFVDPAGVSKLDDHTVEIKLKEPYGPFPAAWSSERLTMSSSDNDGSKPNGTGPFQIESFTAAQEAVFKRFDGYWDEKPGFSTLKVINFQDQPALTNALKGGQIDIANSVPFTDVEGLKSTAGIKVIESEASGGILIEMNLDEAPFTDPKVVEAFKLIVDRQQIVDNAFGGFARVGNDMSEQKTACPAPDVPQRKQDLAKAKQLLADAGQPNITVELTTDGGFPGMLETAQLFSQQAAEAGVTVNVKHIDIAEFIGNYAKWPFAIGLGGDMYFTTIKNHYLPGGEQNATHFNDSEYNALADELFKTVDEDKQCEIVTKMLKIEYERGGDIIPIYGKSIVAHSAKVKGLEPDLYGRAAYTFGGVTIEK